MKPLGKQTHTNYTDPYPIHQIRFGENQHKLKLQLHPSKLATPSDIQIREIMR